MNEVDVDRIREAFLNMSEKNKKAINNVEKALSDFNVAYHNKDRLNEHIKIEAEKAFLDTYE